MDARCGARVQLLIDDGFGEHVEQIRCALELHAKRTDAFDQPTERRVRRGELSQRSSGIETRVTDERRACDLRCHPRSRIVPSRASTRSSKNTVRPAVSKCELPGIAALRAIRASIPPDERRVSANGVLAI